MLLLTLLLSSSPLPPPRRSLSLLSANAFRTTEFTLCFKVLLQIKNHAKIITLNVDCVAVESAHLGPDDSNSGESKNSPG